MSILYQSRWDEMIVAKTYWKINPEGVSWAFFRSLTPLQGWVSRYLFHIIIWPFQGHKIGLRNMGTNSFYMVDYQSPDILFFLKACDFLTNCRVVRKTKADNISVWHCLLLFIFMMLATECCRKLTQWCYWMYRLWLLSLPVRYSQHASWHW